jgi:hypothetical protein
MNSEIKLLDVVAITEDLPEVGLFRGQVGTVVEVYDPGEFEVEFSDRDGEMYALATLRHDQLLLLRHEAVRAA